MNLKLHYVIAIALFPVILSACSSEPEMFEPEGRDLEYEQDILDRLEEYDPEAAILFSMATAASDAGRYEEAREGFERVLEIVPDFPDALRRLSYIQGDLGDDKTALETAKRAMEIDPSPYNKFAVAKAHILIGTPRDARLALELAQSAIEEIPEDQLGLMVLIQAALITSQIEVAEQANAELLRVYPFNPLGHFYKGIIAAEHGRWIKAEQAFRKSKLLGMQPEFVDTVMEETGIQRMANIFRGIRIAAIVLISWVIIFFLLLLLGSLLSNLTLRSIARGKLEIGTTISRGEQVIRMLYRVVIGIASVYFYISIPILFCTILAAVAGVFLSFLQAGMIPLQFSIIIAFGTLVTLYVLLRSVFARYREDDSPMQIVPEDAPVLWEMLYEVGLKLGVKPIDTVIVNPLASVGVKERGSLRKKMMGQGERVLFLGLGTLPSMTIGQFRAILAHEYGHFAHRDTSGGNLAKRVDFSIHSIVVNLAGSGLAHWYNPAWLFVSGYYRIYKRITLGASRLHETLADRYAVIAYGKEDLIDGIRHVIHQQLVFLRQLDLEIKDAVELGRDLKNIYSLPDIEEETEIVKLKEAYESLLNRPTSPYDSHPVPIDRFRMIEQLEGIPQVQTDPSPAWDLIDDIANLQLKMTRVIQQRIPQLQSQPDEIVE